MAYSNSIKNRELLYSLYVDKQLSCREISNELGIKNIRLIHSWLRKFGIPTRNHKEAGAISATRYLDKRITESCSVCGEEVKIHLYRIKRTKKFYCSRECQIRDSGDSLKLAQEAHLQKHPRVVRFCKVCEQAFEVAFSRRNAKYCSKSCSAIQGIKDLASRRQPSAPEQKIIDITEKNFPEFRYNGNGELGVVLNGMIPDFVNVNGKKEVLEVFGDYFHGVICRTWKSSELGRKMAYNYLGYRCLVLWEHDIKTKTEEELLKIIRVFSNQKVKEVKTWQREIRRQQSPLLG